MEKKNLVGKRDFAGFLKYRQVRLILADTSSIFTNKKYNLLGTGLHTGMIHLSRISWYGTSFKTLHVTTMGVSLTNNSIT